MTLVHIRSGIGTMVHNLPATIPRVQKVGDLRERVHEISVSCTYLIAKPESSPTNEPCMPKLSKQAAMDLRIATITYKRDNKIDNKPMNCEALSDKAGLKDGRNALPRFIQGETEWFNGIETLISFLTEQHYFPIQSYNSTHFTYSSFSSFFDLNIPAATSRSLEKLRGTYECTQWSSTESGRIIISQIDIEYDEEHPFATVLETQFYEQEEIFEGCCFPSFGRMVFILRQNNNNRPKFIICNNFNSTFISGLYLKTSTAKQMHISPIYMKRTETNIKPRLDFIENVDDSMKRHMEEPITPFNLTVNADLDKMVKKDLKRILQQYHMKLEE